jgi:hypothetical protein
MLPTSQPNCCPHQTETGAHFEWNRVPTSTGIRNLLEKYELNGKILDTVNLYLASQGIRISTGTIVTVPDVITLLYGATSQHPRAD